MAGVDYRLLLHSGDPLELPLGSGVKSGVCSWNALEYPNLWLLGPYDAQLSLMRTLGVAALAAGWRVAVLDDGADSGLSGVFGRVADPIGTDPESCSEAFTRLGDASRRNAYRLRRNRADRMEDLPGDHHRVLALVPQPRRRHYQMVARLASRDGWTGVHVACCQPPNPFMLDDPLLIDAIITKHFSPLEFESADRALLPHRGGGRRRAMRPWTVDLRRTDVGKLLEGAADGR